MACLVHSPLHLSSTSCEVGQYLWSVFSVSTCNPHTGGLAGVGGQGDRRHQPTQNSLSTPQPL